MELLFVTVIGASISLGVRYLVPGRQTHGALLVPAVGAAATAAVWALGPLASLAVALALPKRREAADAALLERLMRPTAV